MDVVQSLLLGLFVVFLEGVSAARAASLLLQGAAMLLVLHLLVRAAAQALLGGALVLLRMCQKVRWQLLDLAEPKVLLLLWTERVRVVVIYRGLIC